MRNKVLAGGMALGVLGLAWWAMTPSRGPELPRTVRAPQRAPAKAPPPAQPRPLVADNVPLHAGDKVCRHKREEGASARRDAVLQDPAAQETSHGVVRRRDTFVVPAGLLAGEAPLGLRFTYATADREMMGFRVTGLEPDGVAAAMGIQVGDVIGEVNGVPMDGPRAGDAALEVARKEGKGCASLWRDGAWRARYWVVR